MPTNLLIKYSKLLEITHLSDSARITSLKGVFNRDFGGGDIRFNNKIVRPTTKDGQDSLETLFDHFTGKKEMSANGKKTTNRVFEMSRSARLHWVRHHIDGKSNHISIFSYEDRIKSVDVIRTYIYDSAQEYVIILEPQRSGMDYYLLTAYPLENKASLKQIKKKEKNKLSKVY